MTNEHLENNTRKTTNYRHPTAVVARLKSAPAKNAIEMVHLFIFRGLVDGLQQIQELPLIDLALTGYRTYPGVTGQYGELVLYASSLGDSATQ